jgi:UDP:flavonoid glycosyltransferase YjiC (YdhE family)
MKRCLFTWEQGVGLGHVSVLRPLAQALLADGHRVYAAMQSLGRATAAFGGLDIEYLQAPYRASRTNFVETPLNFTEVLANVGFGDEAELAALCSAWRHLYEHVRPDLIVFNHSPTAMLAARGESVRRVVVGTGFEIPPDRHPLPALRDWLPCDQETLRVTDEATLATANRVATRWRARPLERMGELYAVCDLQLLATYRELDHYAGRPASTEYGGCWPNQGGQSPVWPAGDGPRVYGYLKPFAGLVRLLELIQRSGCRALICLDGDPEPARRALSTAENLRLTNQPLDLAVVGQECDLAVLTGSHGATASLLLAGKPALYLPNHLEQFLTARSATRLGAGVSADRKNPQHVASQWDRALRERTRLAEGARRFAQRYASADHHGRLQAAIQRIRALLE